MHPDSAESGNSMAAATGSDLTSDASSGGATAGTDAVVSGASDAGGCAVATTGAARLTSWLASAARTVASIDAFSCGAVGQPLTCCGGDGLTAAGVKKEKNARCPVTYATRYPLTAVPIPAATISTNFPANRRT